MWTDDLILEDLNAQRLAMFVADGEARVRGWPFPALFEIYRHDMSTPLWVMTGTYYSHGGFLSYLAGIAAASTDPRLAPRIMSKVRNMYQDAYLNRDLTVAALAAVTGFPFDEVREVLAGHLTFPAAAGEVPGA